MDDVYVKLLFVKNISSLLPNILWINMGIKTEQQYNSEILDEITEEFLNSFTTTLALLFIIYYLNFSFWKQKIETWVIGYYIS